MMMSQLCVVAGAQAEGDNKPSSSSIGIQLIDKLMSHLDFKLIEGLQDQLISKAAQFANAQAFCSSLVQQNVMDDGDFLLAKSQQMIEKAIKTACAKRAIGSLIVALQLSGNEWLLQQNCFEGLEVMEVEESGTTAGGNSVQETTLTKDGVNNDETCEAADECFSNQLILNKILKFLPNLELLKGCTGVNKLWKKESRLVLRERGDMLARLVVDDKKHIHQVFQDFASDLEAIKDAVPYAGLVIALESSGHDEFSEEGGAIFDATECKAIVDRLDKLPRKHFIIRINNHYDSCEEPKDCPTFQFLKKLLEEFSKNLERLRL